MEKKITILDTIHMLEASYKENEKITIRKCFKHCDVVAELESSGKLNVLSRK